MKQTNIRSECRPRVTATSAGAMGNYYFDVCTHTHTSTNTHLVNGRTNELMCGAHHHQPHTTHRHPLTTTTTTECRFLSPQASAVKTACVRLLTRAFWSIYARRLRCVKGAINAMPLTASEHPFKTKCRQTKWPRLCRRSVARRFDFVNAAAADHLKIHDTRRRPCTRA